MSIAVSNFVATGLVSGPRASAELARDAVRQALAGLNGQNANGVLLFLSADFAQDPQPALLAAARTAGCIQVAGCSAIGILNQDDWVLDVPAAAALAFTAPLTLAPAHRDGQITPSLCLAAPNAINTNWLHAAGQRYGGVAGDITGRGQYKVWSHGKVRGEGRTELQFNGCNSRLLVAHGLRPLSAPLTVDKAVGLDLHRLAGQPAAITLAAALAACDAGADLADVRLCVLCSSADTFSDSDCYPLPLIAHNRLSHTVTVAQRLQAGQRVFWAQRDAGYAATQLSNQLDAYRQQHGRPDFALLFSCGSRGPHLYDGQDRDWRAVRQTFPAMPLLGIYGNGQFAPLADGNRLLDGSAVLALFHGAEHV